MTGFTFISYARDDGAMVWPVAAKLQEHGASIWMDRKIVVGEEFVTVIFNKIKEADKVIAFWSSRSAMSKFVRREMYYADELNKLIGVRLDNTPIHPYYRELHWVDLMGENDVRATVIADILAAIGAQPSADSADTLLANGAPPKGSRGTRTYTNTRLYARTFVIGETLKSLLREISEVAPFEESREVISDFIEETIIAHALLRSLDIELWNDDIMVATCSIMIDWRRGKLKFAELAQGGLFIPTLDSANRLEDLSLAVRGVTQSLHSLRVTRSTLRALFREDPSLTGIIASIRAKYRI